MPLVFTAASFLAAKEGCGWLDDGLSFFAGASTFADEPEPVAPGALVEGAAEELACTLGSSTGTTYPLSSSHVLDLAGAPLAGLGSAAATSFSVNPIRSHSNDLHLGWR